MGKGKVVFQPRMFIKDLGKIAGPLYSKTSAHGQQNLIKM